MDRLAREIIKLARNNPDIRKKLRPVLRKIAASNPTNIALAAFKRAFTKNPDAAGDVASFGSTQKLREFVLSFLDDVDSYKTVRPRPSVSRASLPVYEELWKSYMAAMRRDMDLKSSDMRAGFIAALPKAWTIRVNVVAKHQGVEFPTSSTDTPATSSSDLLKALRGVAWIVSSIVEKKYRVSATPITSKKYSWSIQTTDEFGKRIHRASVSVLPRVGDIVVTTEDQDVLKAVASRIPGMRVVSDQYFGKKGIVSARDALSIR